MKQTAATNDISTTYSTGSEDFQSEMQNEMFFMQL